jgi:tetratricopeptide (TPR) repeat protein
VLGSLVWGLYRFYDAPPVFGYDPFAGYFPGTIYDEDIRITPAFLWYRLYNLLWLAAAILVAARWFEPAALRLALRGAARTRPRARGLLALALLCAAGGAGLYLLRGHAGFAHDAATIRARLGGVRRTAHFDIYYPSELEPKDVELLAQDHEHRYAQLAAQLGVAPRRVRSFIFRTPEEKRALMGAGRTFIAKPWRDEVYLQRLDFPHPVLKHELAHVFAGQFGDRLFRVSLRWRGAVPRPVFNGGLIEGLAVALDWRAYGELDGHQMAAALVRLGLAPPAESLFGYGFLVEAASRSYVFAGSFCRYLLEHHGIAPLRSAYRSGGDFAAAYGRDLSSLLGEWSRWLARVEVPEDQLQVAREHFRQPSIVRRVCGHEVASLLARAAELRTNKPDEAVRLLERACRYDPGDPAHLLELANALVSARRPASALDVSRRVLTHGAAGKPLRREAHELAGDLHWRSGDLAATRSAYDEASRSGAYAAERRVLALKRWALDQDAPVRDAVRDYLVPPEGKRDSALDVHLAHLLRLLLPDAGIGSFLVGKQLVSHDHCGRATPELRRALELGLPNSDFLVEARRVLGACLYRSGGYDEASRIFSTLRSAGAAPRGAQLEAADWLSRINHRQGRGP